MSIWFSVSLFFSSVRVRSGQLVSDWLAGPHSENLYRSFVRSVPTPQLFQLFELCHVVPLLLWWFNGFNLPVLDKPTANTLLTAADGSEHQLTWRPRVTEDR